MRHSMSYALAFGLCCINSAQAGENFNYSAISLSGSLTSTDFNIGSEDKKIDGKAYGISFDYELPEYPIALSAAYGTTSLNKDELSSGSSLESTSYMVGANLILSPFAANAPFDLLPGVTYTTTTADQTNGSTNQSTSADVTSITVSVLARYRLENSLILNTGISHTSYNKDELDNTSTFGIGVEYEADENISIGFNQGWASESSATSFFVKFFY